MEDMIKWLACGITILIAILNFLVNGKGLKVMILKKVSNNIRYKSKLKLFN